MISPVVILDPQRDLRELLPIIQFPLVALSHGREKIEYKGGQLGRPFRVIVKAVDARIGLATVADSDMLVWIASRLTAQMNAGEPLGSTLAARPAEILRVLGRPKGGRQHRLLEASLRRLCSTEVFMDADFTGARMPYEFRLLDAFERPDGTAGGPLQISVPAWIRDCVQRRHVLKIEPAILKHRGLERRLLSWCMAYARRRPDGWFMPLREAYARSGSADSYRGFSSALRSIVVRNPLPNFQLALELRDGTPVLRIARSGTSRTEPSHTSKLLNDDDIDWTQIHLVPASEA